MFFRNSSENLLKMYLAELPHYFVLKNKEYIPPPLLLFRMIPFKSYKEIQRIKYGYEIIL